MLVVDDLEVCRKGLATKLELFSFEPVTVASVDEALARLEAGESFDIVLADELMPGKGGLDLLAALRADPRHAKLPFVMLSLFGADHAAFASLPQHPDAVGLKPIRAYKLATLLDHAFSGEAMPAPSAATAGLPGREPARLPDPPRRGQSGEPARGAAAPRENGRGGHASPTTV